MFTREQQAAIDEKLEQLRKVKEGILTSSELADIISERRALWFANNGAELLEKYKDLPDEEKAYRIIVLEHMKVNPEHSIITRVGDNKIRLDSYNFCPYLEACKILGMDTRDVCKKIGEPSIQLLCEMINPNLRFSRNYDNIRPKNKLFCEEYFEII